MPGVDGDRVGGAVGPRVDRAVVAADAGGVGDPACWLHRLCPECGAVPAGRGERVCWRCGEPADDGDRTDSAGPER